MDAQHDIGSVAFGQQMKTGDLDPDQPFHPERVSNTVVGKLAMVFLGTESRWFSSPTIWIFKIDLGISRHELLNHVPRRCTNFGRLC